MGSQLDLLYLLMQLSNIRAPNQKLSEQHGQDNHISSGHLNWTSPPHHAPVEFYAFRRMRVRFRQARQSLLPFLWEYANSHSLSPLDSCSLSHYPLMSSSQNVQLCSSLLVQVLLWSGEVIASSSAKSRSRPSTSLSVDSKTLVSEAYHLVILILACSAVRTPLTTYWWYWMTQTVKLNFSFNQKYLLIFTYHLEIIIQNIYFQNVKSFTSKKCFCSFQNWSWILEYLIAKNTKIPSKCLQW